MEADGTGEPRALSPSDRWQYGGDWGPGDAVVFYEVDIANQRDIMLLPPGAATAQSLLATPANERVPSFSPDGNYLAYVSDESGADEIWVVPYPLTGRRWKISVDGGAEPVWSPAGGELFYRKGHRMMSVTYATDPEFEAALPELLFDRPYEADVWGNPVFDVTADGSRFIMVTTSLGANQTNQIRVVLNWDREIVRARER